MATYLSPATLECHVADRGYDNNIQTQGQPHMRYSWMWCINYQLYHPRFDPTKCPT